MDFRNYINVNHKSNVQKITFETYLFTLGAVTFKDLLSEASLRESGENKSSGMP